MKKRKIDALIEINKKEDQIIFTDEKQRCQFKFGYQNLGKRYFVNYIIQ